MKLNDIYDISFNAKYIGNVHIQKRKFLKYKPYEVSLVELKKADQSDLSAMSRIARDWRGAIKYLIGNIEPSERILGITTQTDNFEKLDSNKLLGIMQYYDEKKSILLARIQTRPDTKYCKVKSPLTSIFKQKREYKGIGGVLIDKLLELRNGKKVYLIAKKDAIPFYIKKGFKLDSVSERAMTYE
jgi:hypothetical protein